jgi:hypothetical protein
MKTEQIKEKIKDILENKKVMRILLIGAIGLLGMYVLGLVLPIFSNLVRGINDLSSAFNGK